MRTLAAALALSHKLPPVPGTEAPSNLALTAGEREVRRAYLRRERRRRVVLRRAALARSSRALIPQPRRPRLP
jgi:hypothetical protein